MSLQTSKSVSGIYLFSPFLNVSTASCPCSVWYSHKLIGVLKILPVLSPCTPCSFVLSHSGLKGVDKFTCFISFCFVSVADMVTLFLLHSFHHSLCLHAGVYHGFGKQVQRCLIIFAGKFALIPASKNPPLAVPVFSPSVYMFHLVNYLGKEGMVKKLEKPPQEVNA